MSKPAARIGDMHTCPMSDGPKPHVGGPITGPGVPTVLIGGMPAAVVSDICTCVGPPDTIAMGSATVLIGGKPAARMGDQTMHGGAIMAGCPTVLIGNALSEGSETKSKIKGITNANYVEHDTYTDNKGNKIYEIRIISSITKKGFKNNILPALIEAETLINGKIMQLTKTWKSNGKACFEKAFGKQGTNLLKARKNKLKELKKMKKLIRKLKNKPKNFKYAEIYRNSVQDKNTFAYVFSSDKSHTVYLSDSYYSASLRGTDSKAGTILHEISHFNDIAGSDDAVNNKLIYGLKDLKNLTKVNPKAALNHADCLAYYLEKAHGC